ncbi:hypothetical protein, partial [Limnohabitans sp.]|uniref:hypothetical protein n=1 Tax=Limnohabitans sp. TaxID=1907725 RepID=UPI0033409027
IDSSQAAGITSTQLDSFDAADIAALDPAAVGGLTPTALASLDNTQQAALTRTQLGALTSTQMFGLWQSDGAGNTAGVTKTTTDALQSWSAELVSYASPTNAQGTANGSAPLNQYIDRVTGTDIVSDAEFDAGFTITGKAAAGAQSTIRFYLDNDRINGTEEIGTQLTNGSNGVTWTYNNTTGDYTITFAPNSTALKQATHNTHGSGVHKLSVDTSGNGALEAGEASRLFLVASGTAQATDTGQVSQNYSVQDKPTGNVFVYFYGDPDGNGIGFWTLLDNGDSATIFNLNTANRDGDSGGDWDYYNTPGLSGTEASTSNTALGFVTDIQAQVWEFQIAKPSASTMNYNTALSTAGNHTTQNSNTSRLASLAEMMALYAANFGAGANTVGAVQPMTATSSTGVGPAEDNIPGGWSGSGYFWTAAPTPSGHASANLFGGDLNDHMDAYSSRVAAVL